jgi:hypothetical protein
MKATDQAIFRDSFPFILYRPMLVAEPMDVMLETDTLTKPYQFLPQVEYTALSPLSNACF